MTETIEDVAHRVRRLIRAATGEDYGDGLLVSDVAYGCAEPGYDSDAIVVLGNWNNPRWQRDGEPPLTLAERLPGRLGEALERVGADVVWRDEWTTCGECRRAMRTTSDSYGWKMYGVCLEDGYVCGDCLSEDAEAYLDEYVNEPTRAVTWLTKGEMIALGYEEWGDYANGWYPGQTDEPQTVFNGIIGIHPDAKVVFLIDSVGQFDMHFSAWVNLGD